MSEIPPYPPSAPLTTADRAELLLLRRLLDSSVDVELRDGTWLERHGTKWNVYKNARAIAIGADIETAVKIAVGGTNG